MFVLGYKCCVAAQQSNRLLFGFGSILLKLLHIKMHTRTNKASKHICFIIKYRTERENERERERAHEGRALKLQKKN